MEVQIPQNSLVDPDTALEIAMNCLRDLHISSPESDFAADQEHGSHMAANVDVSPEEEPRVENNLPSNSAEWVDLFVMEMTNSTSIDDAKSRAASVLENLEKSISSRAGALAAQIYREQNKALSKDNSILKRAVVILHERQKEKNSEVLQLRQLVAQYQEKTRKLEVSNYASNMHLLQVKQTNSLPGWFNPDVF